MSFRDDVLNYPRGGLSLAEGKTKHDHLANLPPELFEMAEQAAGKGASWSDKLRLLVVGMQSLLDSLQKAEAAAPAAPKPVAESTTQVPVSKSAAAKGTSTASGGAKASESVPPDVEFAAAADLIVLCEGIEYGEAMVKAAERDPELADRYASRHVDGAPPAKLPPLPIPRGYRLITKPADVELDERAEARAAADRCEYGVAMSLILAEDEALASRYFDVGGNSALDELAYRVETIQAAARGRERVTEPKAVSLALAEDPVLKDAVFCYFERI
jgi:hypothetical protein